MCIKREYDFFESVSVGNSGQIAVNLFGRNADVDTGGRETIWPGGGAWVPPTAGRIHAIVSSDAADKGTATAGTGMRTVQVTGLVAGVITTETVTLNGTNAVNTANAYTFLSLKGLTFGSGGTNAGTITATAATDSTVTAQIAIGAGQSLGAVYQIPTGYKGLLWDYFGSMFTSTYAEAYGSLALWIKETGSGWIQYHELGNLKFHPYQLPLSIPAGAYVKVDCLPSADNTIVTAGITLVLEPV